MGTKWNKYNRCPYCSSRRIKNNKRDNTWYCLKCEKAWNGEETLTLSQDFISNSFALPGWADSFPDNSWIVVNNHVCTILGNDFYFNEFNPSRRDSK